MTVSSRGKESRGASFIFELLSRSIVEGRQLPNTRRFRRLSNLARWRFARKELLCAEAISAPCRSRVDRAVAEKIKILEASKQE